jgi:hypothetical protein
VLERDPPRWYVRPSQICIEGQKPVAGYRKADRYTPMPALPIAKSYAGATLLADIVIDKYVNHLPFYRQIQMFISIAPATINGWFGDVADLMRHYRFWFCVRAISRATKDHQQRKTQNDKRVHLDDPGGNRRPGFLSLRPWFAGTKSCIAIIKGLPGGDTDRWVCGLRHLRK